MKLSKRAKVIRAMDLLARCINDEDIFMEWLTYGVADGDITGMEDDEDLSCYCEDNKDFAEVMDVFLSLMKAAKKDGGLYIDEVCSEYANKEN